MKTINLKWWVLITSAPAFHVRIDASVVNTILPAAHAFNSMWQPSMGCDGFLLVLSGLLLSFGV
jgi:hypothetical protein